MSRLLEGVVGIAALGLGDSAVAAHAIQPESARVYTATADQLAALRGLEITGLLEEFPTNLSEAIRQLVPVRNRNDVNRDPSKTYQNGNNAWHVSFNDIGASYTREEWATQNWIPGNTEDKAKSVVVPGERGVCSTIEGVANFLARDGAVAGLTGLEQGRLIFGDLAQNEFNKRMQIGIATGRGDVRLFRRFNEQTGWVVERDDMQAYHMPASVDEAIDLLVPTADRNNVNKDPNKTYPVKNDTGELVGWHISYNDGTGGGALVPQDWGAQVWQTGRTMAESASVVVPGKPGKLLEVSARYANFLARAGKAKGLDGTGQGREMFGDLAQNEPNTNIQFAIYDGKGKVRFYVFVGTIPVQREACAPNTATATRDDRTPGTATATGVYTNTITWTPAPSTPSTPSTPNTVTPGSGTSTPYSTARATDTPRPGTPVVPTYTAEPPTVPPLPPTSDPYPGGPATYTATSPATATYTGTDTPTSGPTVTGTLSPTPGKIYVLRFPIAVKNSPQRPEGGRISRTVFGGTKVRPFDGRNFR